MSVLFYLLGFVVVVVSQILLAKKYKIVTDREEYIILSTGLALSSWIGFLGLIAMIIANITYIKN